MINPLDQISEVELIRVSGCGDLSIVDAARVSYAGDINKWQGEKDEKLIRYLFVHDHGTPFEHNSLTFRVKAPLFVVQEMLRHRIGVSYNQESARYTQLRHEYYVPQTFRVQAKKNKQASGEELLDSWLEAAYINTCEMALTTYENLLAKGVSREQARGVLPHSTYTSLYITFNLRSLFHFLKLRDSEDAQWEIQQYAKAFEELAEPHFPVSFRVWKDLR